MSTKKFDYSAIPVGYYDKIIHTGSPIRRCWHLEKFERVIDCLPARKGQSILDIGCFAGTFLSMLSAEQFSRQLGVDILESQVAYAQRTFGTAFREFRTIPNVTSLTQFTNEKFDCVTLIEVIEHLEPFEISQMLDRVACLLKPGGKLVLSTPNYTSTWPILEMLLNRFSDVSYEEQHISPFNYFNFFRKLKRINPELPRHFTFDFKTTTHFITPFLAVFSLECARKISRLVPHNHWRFPLGNLLLAVLTRRN